LLWVVWIILTILILLIHEHGIFFVFVFNLFHQRHSFLCTDCLLTWLSLDLRICVFDAVVNEIVFFISFSDILLFSIFYGLFLIAINVQFLTKMSQHLCICSYSQSGVFCCWFLFQFLFFYGNIFHKLFSFLRSYSWSYFSCFFDRVLLTSQLNFLSEAKSDLLNYQFFFFLSFVFHFTKSSVSSSQSILPEAKKDPFLYSKFFNRKNEQKLVFVINYDPDIL